MLTATCAPSQTVKDLVDAYRLLHYAYWEALDRSLSDKEAKRLGIRKQSMPPGVLMTAREAVDIMRRAELHMTHALSTARKQVSVREQPYQ